MQGKVKWFSELKGYGFILGEDKREYFVHYSMINNTGYRILNPDDPVTFMPVETTKGPQAQSVALLAMQRLPFPRTLKANPFTPQDPITDPKKFAGRAETLANAVDCLFNNKNILVTGARGIGKSSVAYQLLNLTRGERTLIERLGIDTGGFEFNHLTGDHRCLPGQTLAMIARGLMATLQQCVGLDSTAISTVTRHEWDLKLFKSSEETRRAALTFDEIASEFATTVEHLVNSAPEGTTGVCFLIDEIDVLDPQEPMAPFLKAATEKLRLDGYRDISFMLSGVTGSTTSLIAQHPSASRLTETFNLLPMTREELGEIIDNCLRETDTTATDGAKFLIIELAANFPAPVHLLGYHAFRLNQDGAIDGPDVVAARDFIVQDIKRQEFEGRLERIGGGLAMNILKLLAMRIGQKTTAADIAAHFSTSADKVAGILGDPQQLATFVERKEHRYEISEPLFRIYLRWVFGVEIAPHG